MPGRLVLAVLLLWSVTASAASVTDATGRTVQVPDQVARVLPAGPPAALLLEAIAPDLMIGWPSPVPPKVRDLLAPAAANLPQVPRLTGREDVTAQITALKPDLIVDYGTVSQRYIDLDRTTQQRTGIPTVLFDGALPQTPQVIRTLGALLHREARANTLADFVTVLLDLPPNGTAHPRVLGARGADGLTAAAPGSDLANLLAEVGWQVVAPPGQGPTTIDAIRQLDPDVIVFSDPAMRAVLTSSTAWQSVRAVRDGHAYVAPGLPFGWLEEPPSINRLLGVAWLRGRDPTTLALLFNAVVYGHALTPPQRDTVLAGVRSVQP